MSRETYRPDIDGLRAVAVLAVVIYHAFPTALPGGFTGVDIFFVISGYLISGILFKSLSEEKFSFSEFYARRIRRLFPALITVLALCLGYGWLILLPSEYQQLGKHTAAGALFIQNFIFWKEVGYFDSAASLKPLLHLWSLAIEEQYYIIFPPLLIVLWKWKNKLSISGVLGLLLICSFIANLVMSYQNKASDFFLLTYRAWEFLGGSLLAWRHYNIGESRRISCNWMSSVGAIFIVLGLAAIDQDAPYPGWRALLPVMGTLLLIAAGKQATINRFFLSHPVAIWIGLISYPLYLFHWPIFSFLHIVKGENPGGFYLAVGILLSFVCSILTYYLIEKKIRHYSSRWTVPALITAFLLTGLIGLLISKEVIVPKHNTVSLAKVSQAIKDNGVQDGFETIPDTKFGKIRRIGGDGLQTVFLGDSHMQQYAPRMDVILENANNESRGAIFIAAPATLPIQGLVTPEWNNGQDLMVSFWKEVKENPKIDRVVIGARWGTNAFSSNSKCHYNGLSLSDPSSLEVVMWELEKNVRILQEMGKTVYLLLNIPTGFELDPKNLYVRGFISPISSGVRRLKVADFLQIDKPFRDKLLAISQSTGAIIIDPIPSLSENNFCTAVNADGPIRCDDSHLRPSYVREHVKYLDATVNP
jgi:peptidoglycan/LPS O-acetylase OafA/YrhL